MMQSSNHLLERVEKALQNPQFAQDSDIVGLLREQNQILRSLREALVPAFAEEMVIPFPSDGSRLPTAAGTAFIDLVSGEIRLPANSAGDQMRDLYSGFASLGERLRSVLIWADDEVTINFDPSYGSILLDAGMWATLPITSRQMRLTLARPANWRALFSSRIQPLVPDTVTSHQERYASETITKTNAAGTADTFTAITFTASDGSAQLTPADAGATEIFTGNVGQKVILFENGVNDVDINVQGRQQANGTWIDDPDTGISYRMGSSETKLLVVPRYYHFIRVRCRLTADEAAANTSAIVVQYRGLAPGGMG